MSEKIVILDFGSQYTQLIARRVRELNVYCEIYPYNNLPEFDETVKGVIFSGSPYSVRQEEAPQIDYKAIQSRFPLLGVCYGAQYLAQQSGGEVLPSEIREYGRANLQFVDQENPLLKGIPVQSQVWMSHGDTIKGVPAHFKVISSTDKVRV
ncbi:MAG TPA: gamma-glutamyl-gamma-aminobutyrate hydrolase family protein, partial [Aquaticitalea sp.]|nr:gamma-glutamyl-gamma-aminobutyrate hydrolase family protein [Aquaticitalea sp.]